MTLPTLALLALFAPDRTAAQEPAAREQAIRRELQKFQGTWRFEALETNGKAATAEQLKARTLFVGANAFVVRDGGKVVQIGTLRLDPSKTPPTVNAVVTQGENKDEIMLGIYELDGNTLKVCLDPRGQKRPEAFKAGADSGLALWTCKLARPDEGVDIVGTYRSESVEADGSRLVIQATVERRGDAYLITYRKDERIAYIATGIRDGDRLAVCWANPGEAGVTIFRIEKGPKLVGQGTKLGGIGILATETLTREKD